MATSYRDYTSPNTQFTYDMRNNLFFKKDDRNFIDALGIAQLNTLGNSSLLDIFLTTGNVVEPHIHQNAAELVYCIAGEAIVSLINPFTNQLLNYHIKPRQVANIPQGWWHYEMALTDDTHLLAIFDAPVPEVIFGSDILRLTPASVWAHTYCLDEGKVQETFAPLTQTVVIGPPVGCQQQGTLPDRAASSQYPYYGYSSHLPDSYGYYDTNYMQQGGYGQHPVYQQQTGYPQYGTNPPHTGYPPQPVYPSY
ncbi:cupin domain-containing protein [Brevibacillus brevis]|uniref:cupin domain-containing protein n=1 Tax=Brevibacillus brevis TaxID=1393 RepID=UPI0025A4FAC2|nr:cupin domain-containing protein [Brevibacillus brevis]WJQ83564.1 cupin domain-containing protein [Brevibacillus brevis]